MSTIRLLVRCVDGNWSGIIPGSLVSRAVAALSADPTTFRELQQALRRFIQYPPGETPLAELLPGDWDTPHDLGLVVIDLVGRVVVATAGTVRLARKGELWWQVSGEDGDVDTTKVPLPFVLADDWTLSERIGAWRELAEKRREAAVGAPLDFRAVLYGRPLFDYIALRIWDEFQQAEASGLIEQLLRGQWSAPVTPVWDRTSGGEGWGTSLEEGDPPLERFDFRGSNAEWEIIKRLHVDWLLTPRGDLYGQSPREVALSELERIDSDLDDQARRWSLLEAEPPRVEVESAAFRFSSFGTHEWVEYYHLVRELLWDSWFRILASCSEELAEGADQPVSGKVHGLAQVITRELGRPGSSSGGVHVLAEQHRQRGSWRQQESERLAARAEAWLDQPSEESLGKTPRSVIQRERCRLPELAPVAHPGSEPDCPICEVLARSGQPTFWSLTGCDFDDDFAFDQNCETPEEWREKQVDWHRFLQQISQSK